LLALLALVAAGFAAADTPPPVTGPPATAKPGKLRQVGTSTPSNGPVTPSPSRATVALLTAKLTPATTAAPSTPSTAAGHWIGLLVHTVGPLQNGPAKTAPGCTVTSRPVGGRPTPPTSRSPHQIKCGSLPAVSVPASGQHWLLAWRLMYQDLSSAVTSASINLTVTAGSAPVAPANLCSDTCTSGKFGVMTVTNDQAAALLGGEGSVVVNTADSPSGELSGPVVRAPRKAPQHK
jgi:hypothetical protein